jgi:AcrR family transcriptional regulator
MFAMPNERADGPTPRVPRAEVRERLLEAGARVFADRGIYEARLDDVAADAGFSKGAVYSNFASKDDLVAAVMRRATNAVLESVQRFVRPEVTAAELPDVIRAAFAPFAQTEQFALLSEFRAYALRHPEALPEFVAQRQALQDGVRTVVHAWFAARPEIDPGLPLDDLGVALVAANVGIAFDAPVLDDVQPGEVIARLVEALIRPR